jgi:hypothetical protein
VKPRVAVAAVLVAILLGAMSALRAAEPATAPPMPLSNARFRALDIVIDSATPIAAYQLEVLVAEGDATIVGVEGGEPPLDDPPYYDHAALARDRIILAAFSTSATMPPGRHRVATVHFREVGAQPVYEAVLRVAGDSEGVRRAATVTIAARKESP